MADRSKTNRGIAALQSGVLYRRIAQSVQDSQPLAISREGDLLLSVRVPLPRERHHNSPALQFTPADLERLNEIATSADDPRPRREARAVALVINYHSIAAAARTVGLEQSSLQKICQGVLKQGADWLLWRERRR